MHPLPRRKPPYLGRVLASFITRRRFNKNTKNILQKQADPAVSVAPCPTTIPVWWALFAPLNRTVWLSDSIFSSPFWFLKLSITAAMPFEVGRPKLALVFILACRETVQQTSKALEALLYLIPIEGWITQSHGLVLLLVVACRICCECEEFWEATNINGCFHIIRTFRPAITYVVFAIKNPPEACMSNYAGAPNISVKPGLPLISYTSAVVPQYTVLRGQMVWCMISTAVPPNLLQWMGGTGNHRP